MTLITQINSPKCQYVIVEGRIVGHNNGVQFQEEGFKKIVVYKNGYAAFHGEILRNGRLAMQIARDILPENEVIIDIEKFAESIIRAIHTDPNLIDVGVVIGGLNNTGILSISYRSNADVKRGSKKIIFNGDHDNDVYKYVEVVKKKCLTSFSEKDIDTISNLPEEKIIKIFQESYSEISKTIRMPFIGDRFCVGKLDSTGFSWVKESFD